MRLRLCAALAPRRSHRTPTLAADGADQPLDVATDQKYMTQETLGRKEELLDRSQARHATRGSRRLA